MKKLFYVLVATIVAFSVLAFAACDKPDDEEPPAPTYEAISTQQFEMAAQSFGVFENYLNVLGYKLDGEFVDVVANDVITLSAKLDIGVLEDVALSVSLGVNYDQAGGTGSLFNAYLYSKTLYVDYTQDGVTSKDSVTGVNNDITELLASFVVGEQGSLDLGIDTTDFDAIVEYFKGYLTVTYCAELGHYVLKVDYSQGGTYNGEYIDPFTLDVDLYVMNNRITKIEATFDSAQYQFDIALSEYIGSIDYPQDINSYNGTMLDEVESLISNVDLPETAFYGQWISGDDTLVIGEQGVSQDGETFVEAYSFATYMVYGENNIIILYPEDEMIIVMNVQDGSVAQYSKAS